MSEAELEVILETSASVEAQTEAAASPPPNGDDAPAANELAGKPAGRCHHVMESGFYCDSPALHDRRFCYSHLRLRGQRVRMARAIAQRLPYRFDLPPLDDLYAVQSAVEHVARALGAGLMERRQAGTLLYALQQSAINHRILALLRMNAGSPADAALSAPTPLDRSSERIALETTPSNAAGLSSTCLSPTARETVAEQKRFAEEYPEFEAEFGLPAGMDIAQPAHVLFPPPEDVWRTVPVPAGDPKTLACVHRQPRKIWTKEDIESEELGKQRGIIDSELYYKQAQRVNERIARQERKFKEAAWQAVADRRNAADDEKERQYASMNEGERRAYVLGVMRGLQATQEQAEQEEARKKPAVKAVVSG